MCTKHFSHFFGGEFFSPGTGEFCGVFCWRMFFKTCPKRIVLAVLGRLLLILSYFGWGVGLSRSHSHSGTQYFWGCKESAWGVTWRHR